MLKAALLILINIIKPSKTPMDKVENYSHRVYPWDLDLNFHVNNARYLHFCNHARWVFLAKTGLLPQLFRLKLKPVILENNIKYLQPMKLLDKYSISSQVLHDNNKPTITMVHSVWVQQQKKAQVTAKICFVNSTGKLTKIPSLFHSKKEL